MIMNMLVWFWGVINLRNLALEVHIRRWESNWANRNASKILNVISILSRLDQVDFSPVCISKSEM